MFGFIIPLSFFKGNSAQVPGAMLMGEAVAKTTTLKSVEETQRHAQKQMIKK